ncbi:hypothetical protein [Candidatus Methylocalor cossyra]|uniref:Uncharacterized protein n=1 Tax=Candidatus Methylocalor cossyra TaxID=3108543 RepID=A0ABM9NIS7_9GAMM
MSFRKTLSAAPRRPAWPLLALLMAPTACTTVTTHTASGKKLVMSQEQFSRYVEHVFRYHNRVMNQLIDAGQGAKSPKDAEALSAAEAKMVETCRPLNEVVSESLSGQSLGLQTELELVDTVPACEAATRTVEGLIP